MQTGFVVHHLHLLESGEEAVKLIGVFSSSERARAAIRRLRRKPGFRDYPALVDPKKEGDDQGFTIDEYPIDQVHWSAGFGE
jgi:homoserine kinase type II